MSSRPQLPKPFKIRKEFMIRTEISYIHCNFRGIKRLEACFGAQTYERNNQSPNLKPINQEILVRSTCIARLLLTACILFKHAVFRSTCTQTCTYERTFILEEGSKSQCYSLHWFLPFVSKSESRSKSRLNTSDATSHAHILGHLTAGIFCLKVITCNLPICFQGLS